MGHDRPLPDATWRSKRFPIRHEHFRAGHPADRRQSHHGRTVRVRTQVQQVACVIAKIKEAIVAYALTAADLGLGRGAKAARTAAAKPSKKTSMTTGVAKYRDPKTGKTWTGRGKPPAWIAGVKNRDAYLIDAQRADTSSETPSKPSAKGTRKVRAAASAPRKTKNTPTKGKARVGRKPGPA